MKVTDSTLTIDLENKEFKKLWELINNTNNSVFLTGKAGTGKSTFLKYICDNIKKKYVVLAPTGIAAVNVGGMTMHSFFRMPLKPLLPDDPELSTKKIRETLRYNKEKVKLLKNLDLIIIDEISMVRADMIDFIDKVLRVYCQNMREPFAGKQLLLVGDIFQLEPVITMDMKEILKMYYKNFLFFDAHAFDYLKLVPIELTKVYRQKNPAFVKLLDTVRNNSVTYEVLEKINSRYNPNYKPSNDDFVITLASRRDTVDSINEEHLKAIEEPEFIFKGKIEKEFPEQNLPTLKDLTLKKGAQIIFVKNDKEQRWVNGTLGKICSLDEGEIRVQLENGEEHVVEPALWENIKYTFDEKKKCIKENLLGTFIQYPIKPAWALTIHKSQGLTFNKVVINLGNGGAFACGQTYVALSRCTSMEGIVLTNTISYRDIMVHPSVVEFCKKFNDERLYQEALLKAELNLKFYDAVKAFDNYDFEGAVEGFYEGLIKKNVLAKNAIRRLIRLKLQKLKNVTLEVDRLKEELKEKTELLNDLSDEYVKLGQDSLSAYTVDGEEGRYDSIAIKAAMANYNKAIKVNPSNVDAYLNKGKLYFELDEAEQAIKCYDEALKVDKNNTEVLYNSSLAYTQLENYAKAIKILKLLIRKDKKNISLYELLADNYDKFGLNDLAEEIRDLIDELKKKK